MNDQPKVVPNTQHAESPAPDLREQFKQMAIAHMGFHEDEYLLDASGNFKRPQIASLFVFWKAARALPAGEAPQVDVQSTHGFGQEVTRLVNEIRQPCSMAWRDSLVEQLIELIDPAASMSPLRGAPAAVRDCPECEGTGRISAVELCSRCDHSGILPAIAAQSQGTQATLDDLRWHKEALTAVRDKLGAVWQGVRDAVVKYSGEPCEGEPFDRLDELLKRLTEQAAAPSVRDWIAGHTSWINAPGGDKMSTAEAFKAGMAYAPVASDTALREELAHAILADLIPGKTVDLSIQWVASNAATMRAAEIVRGRVVPTAKPDTPSEHCA
ncbi:hypothetical protein RCH14_004477 [Massilia sp. MP_M2]|uniref:hypothetical protein n=1 Tax=Massilia sp. MP_M2 TaxID=3071713 RepID=UPI00319DCBAA